MSKVTLRSSKEEIVWFLCEAGFFCFEAEMVRSATKIWYIIVALKKRDGKEAEREEELDLMR